MVIHAFFKRMLFLGTGSLISQLTGGQDSRFFGGSLFSFMGFVYFVVRCLCLSGFPFFIGFYSKDLIILSSSFIGGRILFFLFMLGCIFTVCYSFRLVYVSYFSLSKGLSYSFFVEEWNFFFFFVCFFFFVFFFFFCFFFFFFLGVFFFFFFVCFMNCIFFWFPFLFCV